jgi:predicted RNA binding protein YcfA (HicA-like mRNA interferase family)
MPPKIRDVLRRLADDGWVLKSQSGSHRQFVHPTKPGKVTVAGHPSKETPEGSYRSILKQSGLTK